jgi:hypothetical protein
MRYQLVLKFQGDSLADTYTMGALLDALMEVLGDSADVDDIHVGGSGTNIFIWTADPRATFERARLVLESRRHLRELTAAYRPAEGKSYTMIWPEGSHR